MEGRHITCKSHSTNLFLLVLLLSIKLLVTLELTLEVAETVGREKPPKASTSATGSGDDMEAGRSGASGEEGVSGMEERVTQQSPTHRYHREKHTQMELKGEAEDGEQLENHLEDHSGVGENISGHENQPEDENHSSSGQNEESGWQSFYEHNHYDKMSGDSSGQSGFESGDVPDAQGSHSGELGEGSQSNSGASQDGGSASGDEHHSGNYEEYLMNHTENENHSGLVHLGENLEHNADGSPKIRHRKKRQDPESNQQINMADHQAHGDPRGAAAADGDFYFNEDSQVDDEANSYKVEVVEPNKHKGPCTHDDRTIMDGAVVYMRAECRLCQCADGTMQCEVKPPNCTNRALACVLERGGELKDGDIHYDGCNRCLCQNGELLCTRMRCKSSWYNYTNYARITDESHHRGLDPCLECDHEPISAVCGSNGKTYRSMCHAYFCAGLKLQDLEMGACENLDPCQLQACKGKDEICIASRQTCLAVETRAGQKLDCPRHKCVARKETCPLQNDVDQAVCGTDGQTYPTECHLVANSVLLAYHGSCRESCVNGDYQVCGVDAITFESPCQANLLNQYTDYQGICESFAAKPDVIMQWQGPDVYINRRCSRLDEKVRCPTLTCQEVVTPQGTCCPVCGAALSIHLDPAIQDMIDVHVVQLAQDMNSLNAVYTAIVNLQDPGTLHKCRITVDLADTNDVVSTFVPQNSHDVKACVEAARTTVEKIFSRPDKFDPYQALLASAVMAELDKRDESEQDIGQQSRVRREVHHEHDADSTPAGNNTSAGHICSHGQIAHFSWIITSLLSWGLVLSIN